MSFFSSTKNVPPPKQKPFNVDEQRTSTNEQARPVPYFAGIIRLEVTFISPVFKVKSQKVKMRVGKKKETVGYNYFASFAALISHGPIDRVDAIWMDGELVWSGPLARSGDYATLTIEGRGNVRLYWGTDTQTQDSILATSGTVHPAYRGQAYMVFDQLFFGRDRTNAPNIEVLVTRWPNAPWLATPNSIQDDVNPVIPLWDLWTNPRYGLGLPESRLDMDSLAAAGEQLNAEGIGVSPVLTRPMSLRQFLIELCECFDAYPTYDEQGRLGLALVRESVGAVPAIGRDDLVDAPTLNPQGWHDTFNETFVRFTDRDHRFEESSVAYRDRGNFQITQAVLSQSLSRLWITRQAVAQKVANAAGRVAAQPLLSGSMRVRKSSGANLAVGGLFTLDFPQSGVEGVLCRVERLTLPAPGQGDVSVAFSEDTGFFNADHYAAGADRPPELSRRDQLASGVKAQDRIPLALSHVRVFSQPPSSHSWREASPKFPTISLLLPAVNTQGNAGPSATTASRNNTPVCRSHSRKVPSLEPTANRRQSWEITAEYLLGPKKNPAPMSIRGSCS